MTLVMLNQRWMFKNAKYKIPGENFYGQENVGRLISESAFVGFQQYIYIYIYAYTYAQAHTHTHMYRVQMQKTE